MEWVFGPNGHDGIWHIALAESLAKGSWGMPAFAGESIKNYHIGFDLLLSAVHKVTFIPINILYFQILPPVFAVLIGTFCYFFVLEWKKSKAQAFWATLFVYFGGGLGYFVTLFRTGELTGESLFWSQQAVSTLVNPPFALSLIIVFYGLYLLLLSFKKEDNKSLAFVSILLGLLVQIKVYAGLLILAGLFCAGFYEVIKNRKFLLLKVFIGSLVVSILVFASATNDLGTQVIFKPFWFLEQMLITPDHLNWPRFGEALINYKLALNLVKGIPAHLVAFSIFIIGNFGTRLIGLLWFWKKGLRIFNYQYMDVLIVVVIAAGVFVPTFFVQSGNSWNTIQFMYYSLVFSAVLAGIVVGEWQEKAKPQKGTIFRVSALFMLLLLSLTHNLRNSLV